MNFHALLWQNLCRLYLLIYPLCLRCVYKQTFMINFVSAKLKAKWQWMTTSWLQLTWANTFFQNTPLKLVQLPYSHLNPGPTWGCSPGRLKNKQTNATKGIVSLPHGQLIKGKVLLAASMQMRHKAHNKNKIHTIFIFKPLIQYFKSIA